MEKKWEKSEKNPLGFGFIEILISFVITFLLILGTAQLTMLSLLSKRNSDLRFTISEHLFSKLESFKSLSYDESILEEGTYDEWTRDLTSGAAFIWNWHIYSISTNLTGIEMGCYPENHPEKEISLIVYISRDLGF